MEVLDEQEDNFRDNSKYYLIYGIVLFTIIQTAFLLDRRNYISLIPTVDSGMSPYVLLVLMGLCTWWLFSEILRYKDEGEKKDFFFILRSGLPSLIGVLWGVLPIRFTFPDIMYEGSPASFINGLVMFFTYFLGSMFVGKFFELSKLSRTVRDFGKTPKERAAKYSTKKRNK
ncbi:MAG: hypothetical protein GY810_13315 [Aureispira sp.]|nr:hypothetical protein [Aureispira sp.]